MLLQYSHFEERPTLVKAAAEHNMGYTKFFANPGEHPLPRSGSVLILCAG